MGQETRTVESVVELIGPRKELKTVLKTNRSILHSEGDCPALVASHNGQLVLRSWFKNGVLTRTGGPAVEMYQDGRLWMIEWYADGLVHRAGGPAVTECGSRWTVYHAWYDRGEPHRLDGPAILQRNSFSPWNERWFLAGTEVPSFRSILSANDRIKAFAEYARDVSQNAHSQRLDIGIGQVLAVVAEHLLHEPELAKNVFLLGALCKS